MHAHMVYHTSGIMRIYCMDDATDDSISDVKNYGKSDVFFLKFLEESLKMPSMYVRESVNILYAVIRLHKLHRSIFVCNDFIFMIPQ